MQALGEIFILPMQIDRDALRCNQLPAARGAWRSWPKVLRGQQKILLQQPDKPADCTFGFYLNII